MDREPIERIEPITVTRNGRRYFSREHKRKVVQACLAPGASMAAVALAYGFNANLVRRWVAEAQQGKAWHRPRLVPVVLDDAGASMSSLSASSAQSDSARSTGKDLATLGTIELQVGSARLSVRGCVDEHALAVMLKAMGGLR